MTAVQPSASHADEPAAEAPTRTLTLIEAVREALREEMARDDRVVVLGEDIGPLGGVFRATDGLLAEFGPERVIDTPMMELGIAGLAVGMAMRGLRPVAEIQFADFMHAAADHLISDAARMRFRTNGDWECPLVVRTAYGGGLRGGPYHSQSVEAYYAHVPGLRVVAASFPGDAKGLLTAAIRDPDPVLFLEHKRTYRAIRGEVPSGEYVLPLDQARVVRSGSDLTVIAWGWVLHEALAAAEALADDGVDVEIVDPRSLNPLDVRSMLESVRKTGRLCVVHEDTQTMGLGAEIAALAAEHALDDLRAPVQRIAMPDVAGIPASAPMEDFVIPDRARIASALRELARIDRGQRSRLVASDVLLAQAEPPQAASVVEIDLSHAVYAMQHAAHGMQARGVQPSVTHLVAEALVGALKHVPHANAAWTADGIRRSPAVHLGLTLSTADGQACHGVVRDADTRNLLGLALEIEAVRAAGQTDPSVLQDATVTLTDFGPASSVLFAVPSVQPGQAVAVRVGAVEDRPLAQARGFLVAPTAFVCASIDHRVLDGRDAGAVLTELKRALEA
jgi:2-oxoisovalerate dehydrogenase E1 component beta subunit